MAVLLGLFVAAGFGSGDFLGGLASRRAPTIAVLMISQLCALVGAVLVATPFSAELNGRDLAFAALAGVLNVLALGCLYQGLAIGQIGQVAPIAAVVAAIIPVGWGLITGERPPPLAIVGVVMAVIAGGLISREQQERDGPFVSRALPLAIVAGLAFGSSFVCFATTSRESGFWPVLSGRVAAVVVVLGVVLVTRTSLRVDRVTGGQAFAAGALDVTATALLLVAVRTGLATIVAPVAALAPAFNVGHAWWYLHERASRVQLVGLALALAGLVLIALGTVTS